MNGSTRSFTNKTDLDCLRRPLRSINQGPDGTFANGDDLTTQYVYDTAGRQISQIDGKQRCQEEFWEESSKVSGRIMKDTRNSLHRIALGRDQVLVCLPPPNDPE